MPPHWNIEPMKVLLLWGGRWNRRGSASTGSFNQRCWAGMTPGHRWCPGAGALAGSAATGSELPPPVAVLAAVLIGSPL